MAGVPGGGGGTAGCSVQLAGWLMAGWLSRCLAAEHRPGGCFTDIEIATEVEPRVFSPVQSSGVDEFNVQLGGGVSTSQKARARGHAG